ncbi:MAG: anthranilate synthase component I, partial [Rhizomicrobium sp.]
MSLNPDFHSFARIYAAKKPQALFRRLVADLETPVSAFLKLGFDENNGSRDNAFLLESVQGGETRGRYSIIGLKPDLIWRCRGDVAEINRQATTADTFVAEKFKPLESLRTLIAATQMELPAGLPPMAPSVSAFLDRRIHFQHWQLDG